MSDTTCPKCNKVFGSTSVRNKHIKNIHNENIIYDISKYNAKCFKCLCSFPLVSDLRKHLMLLHNFENVVEELDFSDLREFRNWLSSMSEEANVQYVAATSKSLPDCGGATYFYNCSRSYLSRGRKSIVKPQDRKRCPKSQGSCKLDYLCTSQIKAVKRSKKVHVTYYKTHYNHSFEVQHLKLSQSERNDIASKLISGLSVSEILAQSRNNFVNGNIQRINLISRTDIRNIKLSLGIVSDEAQQNDCGVFSIQLFVEEQVRSTNNSVVYYKREGQSDNLLGTEDFCLIIMNKFQLDMLEKFGENLISINSSGLNHLDYEITTVMVVDELEENFPIASMVSNRKDTFIYEVFFTTIKNVVGTTIKTKTFFSDVTTVFVNAWKSVMCNPIKHFYCAWRVDKTWQTNLESIQNFEKRKNVYKAIKFLQHYQNKSDFPEVLENTIQTFLQDIDTVEWGNYFLQYYANNYQLWALCYREDFCKNTKMPLESIREKLKHYNPSGQHVIGLDRGVEAMLKYVHSKIIKKSMLRKNSKRINDILITNIHRKHAAALTYESSVDVVAVNSVFHVSYENNLNIYEVRKLFDNSCCSVRCTFCDICIHMFTCTCSDFYVKQIICQHIHAIVIKNLTFESNLSVDTNYTFDETFDEVTSVIEIFEQTNNTKSELIDAIDNGIMEIREKIKQPGIGEEVLCEVHEYLKNTLAVLNSKVSTPELHSIKPAYTKINILGQQIVSTQNYVEKATQKPKNESPTSRYEVIQIDHDYL